MSIETPRCRADGRASAAPAPRRRLARAALVAGVLVLAAGCGTGNGDPPVPAAVEEDPVFEGLSREEIERQAEPMTLEEAERLGIVDTTIRIESPIHPDSIIELPPPPEPQ
jgi:hypothetical protein